jgi:uncharacterized protein (TIGR01319 family)
MSKVMDLVDHIIPTPGAVMECAKLLNEHIGELVVIDVGGATTDIHSVCEASDEVANIQIAPEPIAKRTVEGDLGLFVNLESVYEICDKEKTCKLLECAIEDLDLLVKNKKPIPTTDEEIKFIENMCKVAVQTAMLRHAGIFIDTYTTSGKTIMADGKDLTGVKYILGTGGALTRLPNRVDIINSIHDVNMRNDKLFPNKDVKVIIDNDYIMSCVGTMASKYPEAS